MALSINWNTRVISVPKTFLHLIATNSYSLDIDEFRLALKELEASDDGQVNPDTHVHHPEVHLNGTIYPMIVKIINGYTVTFEDGDYTVTLFGAASNIANVHNQNSVHVLVDMPMYGELDYCESMLVDLTTKQHFQYDILIPRLLVNRIVSTKFDYNINKTALFITAPNSRLDLNLIA